MALPVLTEWCAEGCDEIEVPSDDVFKALVSQYICSVTGGASEGALESTQQEVLTAIEALVVGSGGIVKTELAAENGLNLATLNDEVVVDVSERKSVAVHLVEAFTGTIIFEGSIGELPAGTKIWFTLTGANIDNDPVTTATAPGIFFFDAAILIDFRVRVSVTGSGDIGYIITTSTV